MTISFRSGMIFIPVIFLRRISKITDFMSCSMAMNLFLHLRCVTQIQVKKIVKWRDNQCKALYLDRLGVNVNYLRRGMGGLMLEKARETARNLGAEYLRLFVVDINEPAIGRYYSNGFTRADSVYDEVIDEDLILHEYGFEVQL